MSYAFPVLERFYVKRENQLSDIVTTKRTSLHENNTELLGDVFKCNFKRLEWLAKMVLREKKIGDDLQFVFS